MCTAGKIKGLFEMGQQNGHMNILLRDWALNNLAKSVILYSEQAIQGWYLEVSDCGIGAKKEGWNEKVIPSSVFSFRSWLCFCRANE
jgi:hypothetical protein